MDLRTQQRIKKTEELVKNKTLEQLYELRRYCARDMVVRSEDKWGFWIHGKIVEDFIAAHEQFEIIVLGGEDV